MNGETPFEMTHLPGRLRHVPAASGAWQRQRAGSRTPPASQVSVSAPGRNVSPLRRTPTRREGLRTCRPRCAAAPSQHAHPGSPESPSRPGSCSRPHPPRRRPAVRAPEQLGRSPGAASTWGRSVWSYRSGDRCCPRPAVRPRGSSCSWFSSSRSSQGCGRRRPRSHLLVACSRNILCREHRTPKGLG